MPSRKLSPIASESEASQSDEPGSSSAPKRQRFFAAAYVRTAAEKSRSRGVKRIFDHFSVHNGSVSCTATFLRGHHGQKRKQVFVLV
jgi:hypothetical protein